MPVTSVAEVHQFREKLQESAAFAHRSKAFLDAAAVVLAFVPGGGGPAALIDKAAARMGPDMATEIDALAAMLQALSLDLDRIDDLDQRLSAIAEKMSESEQLRSQLIEAMKNVEPKLIHIETVEGHFRLDEAVLQKAKFLSEASGGGRNEFGSITASDTSLHWKTTNGGSQHVRRLVADGNTDGMEYNIRAQNMRLGEGDVHVAHSGEMPDGRKYTAGMVIKTKITG